MEGGGGEDDEGSGWFEVKKKNRTSSKLSIQKVSGGSSYKTQTHSSFQASPNAKVGNSCSRQHAHTRKDGVDYVVDAKLSSDVFCSSAVIADIGIDCLDKMIVNLENGPQELLPHAAMEAITSEVKKKEIQDISIKEKLDVPKIKWGDLEDEALSLSTVYGNSLNLETDYGASVASVSSCTFYEGKLTMEAIELLPDDKLSSDVHGESLEGTWKEVTEIPSENLGFVKADPTYTPRIQYGDGVTKMNENEHEADVGRNDPMLRDSPALSVEGTPEVVPQESHDTSEKGAFNVSEVDAMSVDRGVSVSIQDTISHLPDAIEISGEASLISATGLRGLHNLTEGTYLGESEEGESKERFRERLWCFLFENLNRAVDELYLLCELECDMDQMIEAILILEEASTDFKELKCRVEHFENTKRSTTQLSKDGMPVTAKADHRRPHALSWEVRRMTTSPHRAEILSSSLEAFKKVQLERTRKYVNQDPTILSKSSSTGQHFTGSSPRTSNLTPKSREPNTEKQGGNLDPGQGNTKVEKSSVDAARQSRASSVHNGRFPPQNLSASAPGKSKRELLEPIAETEKQLSRKDKVSVETKTDKQLKANDIVKKQTSVADKEKEKEKERRNTTQWKPIDAWKEKRNWEDILKSPLRNSSRVSHSPGLARKGMERARVLHDKLMSPEKRRKNALDMKKEAEEKHARAMRIRSQLENERLQRLQRTSEKLNRVNEWQAVRSLKLREGMHARHRQSESRHEAYLAQVARRAGDESSKVNEVRFITSLNEENKKFILRQKLYDSEMRRAEKLQVIKTKQKEDTAREEAVLERRKLLEAEKLQRLAETQRKKEEAQVRREEERKASSAAREAKALEQLRKKEVRAKAQQEEAELLAQKLAERLSESEQRRKFYLEQIREKASMDFRDQSSPLLRRPLNKEGQNRSISTNSTEDYQTSFICSITGDSIDGIVTATQQQSLKRRIKKIRQRLMALKYEFIEPPTSVDNSMIGYRALVGTARAKIGRWLQDLQRLRQARKEGSASIGLIVGDMIKFLEGKDPELHASRQAGLLDFISSALPASHTSKPTACQVTVYLLRLLRVVLSAPANRTYFLLQNLLSPIIPMLSASLENYIKIAASFSPGSNNSLPSKTSTENLESIAEVLDGFLWTVTIIIGCVHTDERQLQMQDGLLELIVSYQIIHRLRDLFALYDRPQVEGNPFPSSILLSLNLLVALTSRSKIMSPIDWEACISKAAPATKIQETKGFEYPATEEFSVGENSTKHVTADTPFVSALMSQEKLQLTVTGIPESKSLDGECRNESIEVANVLDDVGREKKVGKSTSGDVLVFEENAKKNSSQKDENNLVDICTEKKRNSELVVPDNIENRKDHGLKQPVAFFLYAIAETGLVGLPSLLTAVLLQANNRQSSEQASYILPSNFEEVACAVLKVLNNLALLDIVLLQKMLARPDLKMEFFHLMSFLLSYCTNKWRTANDQVGLLLLESLLLLGYFGLFHPGNQAVLRWGKSPTILHKVCDLPFVFFSDPELTPILASTLVAACYGCEQNRDVVLQELSTEMLITLLKSCRQGFLTSQSDTLPPDSSLASDQCEGIQLAPEYRRPQGDTPLKLNRRSTRMLLGKGGVSGSNTRANKVKGQRESRGTKTCDEWALKHNLPALGTSHTFMLHRRFPTSFLDKAEEFFSAESSDLST